MSEGDKPKLEIYLLVSWKPLTTTMLSPHRYKSIIKRIKLENLRKVTFNGVNANMVVAHEDKILLTMDKGNNIITTLSDLDKGSSIKYIDYDQTYRLTCNEKYIATLNDGELKICDWDGMVLAEISGVEAKGYFGGSQWYSYGRSVHMSNRYLLILGEENKVIGFDLRQLDDLQNVCRNDNWNIFDLDLNVDRKLTEICEDMCLFSDDTILAISINGVVVKAKVSNAKLDTKQIKTVDCDSIQPDYKFSENPDPKRGSEDLFNDCHYTCISTDKKIIIGGFLYKSEETKLSYIGFTLYSARTLNQISNLHVTTVPKDDPTPDEVGVNSFSITEFTHVKKICILHIKRNNFKLVVAFPVRKHVILMATRDNKTLQLISTTYVSQYSFRAIEVINQKTILLSKANGLQAVDISFK